jgi:hypothetical protein
VRHAAEFDAVCSADVVKFKSVLRANLAGNLHDYNIFAYFVYFA